MKTEPHEKTLNPCSRVRLLLATSLCLGTLLAVMSCQPPGGADLQGGTLTISIGQNMSRTLVPVIDMTIASYAITGVGPGGGTFSQSSAGAAVSISGLAFGQWAVTVNGKNAAGTVIGQGSGTVSVDTGKQSSLTITVTPLSGNGTINLSVSWAASNVQSPSISAQLLGPSGSQIPLAFTLGTGSASCQNAIIPSGYYTLSLQLFDTGVLIMGAVEVARIVSAQTTTGAFDFTQAGLGTGGIAVGITPVISDPLAITLTGQVATLTLGSSMTITAAVAGNVGNVGYVWYVNGQSMGTGSNTSPSFTLGSALPVGVYRLDMTAITADGLRAGAASCTFKVQ